MDDQRSLSDLPPAQSVPPRSTLGAARLALGWERLWPASWRAACVVAVFLAVALTDLLPALPGWLHMAALLATLAALGATARSGFQSFRWPSEAEALRRLERHNGLAHRPLLTLRDRPAAGDPVAEAVWRIHCRTMAERVRRLRVPSPRPGVAARDPYGLRMVAAVLLVAGAAVGWGDWGPRLRAALSPGLDGGGLGAPAALDLWLAPPDYTGVAPIFLRRAGAEPTPAGVAESGPTPVPAGSAVLARLSGGGGAPTLSVNGASIPFTVIDDDHFQARDIVRGGAEIAVWRGGRSLGRWPVSVVADQPPAVAFTAPPSATERGALRLDFQASDDYGVAGVAATARLDPKAEAAAGMAGGPLTLPLPLPGLNQKSVRGAGFEDLTASPWAGLPALIRLTATDAGGNTGVSDEVAVTLPERTFLNPVAREIVAQRKRLIPRGEEARSPVAQALSGLSIRPGLFHDDAVVFLALRVAVARLVQAGDVASVRDLLWETALRLEDGGLSLAERDLRDAERALSEALDANASNDEIRRRMDDLQAALDRYLDSMARQAADPSQMAAPDPNAQALDREDLEAMMNALREMAETGGREGARQMLSDLRQLLEGMQGGGAGGGGAGQSQTLEALRDLQDITARQRELLERGQAAPSPSPGATPAPGSAADDQGRLRERLGAVMRDLGEANGDIPRPLGQAERAMREAELALRLGGPGAAAPAQTRALEALRRGARDLGRMMVERMSGGGHDPLGRRAPGRGSLDSANVHVPEQRELQRAREILDELRRRAGQRERPRQELDYIERLLRQF